MEQFGLRRTVSKRKRGRQQQTEHREKHQGEQSRKDFVAALTLDQGSPATALLRPQTRILQRRAQSSLTQRLEHVAKERQWSAAPRQSGQHRPQS